MSLDLCHEADTEAAAAKAADARGDIIVKEAHEVRVAITVRR